jgi:2-dehydropantoate 2-reductase
MRYVILGAGAIGGAVGGRLFQHGLEVVLVARGEHLEVLQSKGLELRDPAGSVVLPVPAVPTAAAAGLRADDVILLAAKSQHSEGLLADLALCAPAGIAVACAQNGVENERLSARRFANTYGIRVLIASTHLDPGVVEVATAPVWGILDVGRYPGGSDAVAEQMAADLCASGFDAAASPHVMRYKYLKLLGNVGNAIEAACGPERDATADRLRAAARSEARACYAAAGIELAESDETERRRWRGFTRGPGSAAMRGGSSWQSLRRQTGNIEADWLNGEIVLLGRLHGVPTPVNERLQAVANRMALERTPPGSMTADELAAGLL